jgi:UDP-N-acetylmuramate dehydrogenase
MSALEDQLKARFGERLKANRMLAEFTSFRIGGPADLLVEVEDEGELRDALAAANRHGAQAFCLGAGTNLLVSDRGMRGLVIRLGHGFERIEIAGRRVIAGAGA